ncbi:unnamed protein product [Moneuplotes crassus]|uniref:GrpE protein homolog n=1 Tax=Euplotes crassus TaxID=5936 RepID=A0AAD1XXC8_EUPCR|nr:unnamed protein product [Moneuplotes crassus]
MLSTKARLFQHITLKSSLFPKITQARIFPAQIRSFSKSFDSDDSDEEITLKAKEIRGLLKDQDDEIEALTKKVKNAKKQLRNEVAEIELIDKRYKEEIQKAKEFSISKFAKDLISVRDDLQRAYDYSIQKHDEFGGEHTEEEAEKIKKELTDLFQGVKMTNKVFDQTLNRFDIQKVSPLGEEFDQRFHILADKGGRAKGKIADVVEPGYKLGKKYLRKPKVSL